MFSRGGHVTLPVVVVSDMEGEGVAEKVEQAEDLETREEELKHLEESLQPAPPPPDKPARANVKQLQRPRKRPRRCDVCEKDFKSVGKMQAHRYEDFRLGTQHFSLL